MQHRKKKTAQCGMPNVAFEYNVLQLIEKVRIRLQNLIALLAEEMPHEFADSDPVQMAIAVAERFAPEINGLENFFSIFLGEAPAGLYVTGGYCLCPLIIREVFGKRLRHFGRLIIAQRRDRWGSLLYRPDYHPAERAGVVLLAG